MRRRLVEEVAADEERMSESLPDELEPKYQYMKASTTSTTMPISIFFLEKRFAMLFEPIGFNGHIKVVNAVVPSRAERDGHDIYETEILFKRF